MIEIIPAIDIIDGRAVRLTKGDYSTRCEYGDPLEMARVFADCGAGRLHLVDLDGAKASTPCNLRTLEAIASLGTLRVEWGGGLKSEESLRKVFDAGADYAIVGSLAALHPELFEEWLLRFGAEKMILGADVLDGTIRVKGWIESAPATLEELLTRFAASGLTQAVCTDISRDGMLSGPSVQMYCRLASLYPSVKITVSGGISSMEDIRELDNRGLDRVIVGKAFYEGRITIGELKEWWQSV